MMFTEILTFYELVEKLPDDGTTVVVAIDPDTPHSEPVWLGYLDGDQWRDVAGEPITVLRWAEVPAGAPVDAEPAPLDMVLHCPQCGMQHVDGVELVSIVPRGADEPLTPRNTGIAWSNPPHRSHVCHDCGCIWRPADVPTNGVDRVASRGKADTWPRAEQRGA